MPQSPDTVVWTPTLTYCQPVTLTVVGEATIDTRTLLLPDPVVTTWELDDGRSGTMKTLLDVAERKIYLPLVTRGF